MIGTLLLAAGFVLIAEGLVLALAPKRVEDALRLLAALPAETRRLLGFGALVLGILLYALARGLGG